jgi:hypothetical protein
MIRWSRIRKKPQRGGKMINTATVRRWLQAAIGALLVAILVSPGIAVADGMIMESYEDGTWDYGLESNQQAFINYESGMQKMIISIGMAESTTHAVWIFPVPAKPDKVVIDIFSQLPEWYGQEIGSAARAKLDEITAALNYTQLYTIPFMANWVVKGDASETFGSLAEDAAVIAQPGVVVHEHLDKENVTTEIITAETAQALYSYLQAKDLSVEEGSIPVLDHYIGKEYTFVVSWMSNPDSEVLIPVDRVEVNLVHYLCSISTWLNTGQSQSNITTETVLTPGDYLDQVRAAIPDLEEALMGFYEGPNYRTEKTTEYLDDHPEDRQRFIDFLSKNPVHVYPFQRYEHLAYMAPSQRGVFVTFPTERIYYPLLPTSVYGSDVVPATIRTIGWVSPQLFSDIQGFTEAEYYVAERIRSHPSLRNFYDDDGVNARYTKIDINAPSKLLTDDLWISQRAPWSALRAAAVAHYPWPCGIFLLLLASFLAGLLAGVAIFAEARNIRGVFKFGLIGLANCLSILGFIIVVILAPTKAIRAESSSHTAESEPQGFSAWGAMVRDARKWGYVPLFSAFFLVAVWYLTWLVESTF